MTRSAGRCGFGVVDHLGRRRLKTRQSADAVKLLARLTLDMSYRSSRWITHRRDGGTIGLYARHTRALAG